MVGSSESGRGALWLAVVLAGTASVGLVAVAVMADLNTAALVSSLIGAVVGLVGAVGSFVALIRTPRGSGRVGRQVRARRGGFAAGGNFAGNAVGDRSQVSGPRTDRRPTTQRGHDHVQAGPGAVVAGGDMTDNAFGNESRR